jgi:hypothetical protein
VLYAEVKEYLRIEIYSCEKIKILTLSVSIDESKGCTSCEIESSISKYTEHRQKSNPLSIENFFEM